jgi:integrase
LGSGSEIWDGAVAGFGARRQRGDAIAYVLLYRTEEGRQRRYTIGRHGAPWTPHTAREEAVRLLGCVAEGEDPSADKQAKRASGTVGELCDAYLADAAAGRLLTRMKRQKSPSTLITDRGRINGHIRPLLGNLPVATVTSQDVEKFMHAVAEGKTRRRAKSGRKRGVINLRGGQGTASRTVGLLGAIFTYAVKRRMRLDNPVHGVLRPADGRRDRRLSDAEYGILGDCLHRATKTDIWPLGPDMAKFLALTGWRSGEALTLRWDYVDLDRRTAILPTGKTGRSMRPLPEVACHLLRSLPKTSALVFPASRGDGQMVGFRKIWNRMGKLGGLSQDVTPHVLRHSFASLASDLGYSEPTIAALIGHKGRSITSRYVHAADNVLLAAADAIAAKTLALMKLSGAKRHGAGLRVPGEVDRAAVDLDPALDQAQEIMLEIPDWVPPGVAALARETHGSLNVSVPELKDYADVVERLACDDRMRRVWRELQKKHRAGQEQGSYFHPASHAAVRSHPLYKNMPGAREAIENLTEQGKLQNEACALLFNEVAKLRSWPAGDIGPRTKTTKEATREIAELRAVAQNIGATTKRLRDLRLGYLSPSLEETAAVCISFADMHAAHNEQDVLIVSRNSSRLGGEWERGFVITVARILEHFFRQKMHRLVAVLANVAFDRNDVTESKVNSVLRHKGCAKRQLRST